MSRTSRAEGQVSVVVVTVVTTMATSSLPPSVTPLPLFVLPLPLFMLPLPLFALVVCVVPPWSSVASGWRSAWLCGRGRRRRGRRGA